MINSIQIKKRETITNIKDLSEILGLKGTFGEYPRTIEISITYALEYLKLLEKVIPRQDPQEIGELAKRIENYRIYRKNLKIAENLKTPVKK
jgi:hypothetical protein